ncbi:TonB-dependent receptor domain-containing protein [Brevundimonas sp. P7753]|uniref:TonB-dependent receptor domain-containing protein n=1 Tax=Brevundimonas sp. P7753 TaxID=2726982 RepID=UPI002105AD7C|nr:TonB-dependent receptor [Brevundimonas sp. P7753]
MMLRSSYVRFPRLRMLAGAGCAALMIAAAMPAGAASQSAVASFNIRSASLSQSLLEFGRQAGISIAADQSLTAGQRGAAVSGELPVGEALDRLLAGTGLKAEFAGPNAVRLVRVGQGDAGGNDLRPSGQDGGQEATTVGDIIVTAQKREESIQDVPIAVSAFSAETLDAMKIEGGSELLRAIPNVSFSKANFSMYNFSIRGIGTKAVSASSDPAVAVSFNNTPLIRNRLFEQEYLDVNRVEVLRGPQGTLYGRNATAGVVNMIPNLPGPDFDAMLKAEAGNFGSMRGQMMVNIPLADTFWVRAAASLTKREGFDHNTFKDTRVNGRDLYSTRLSAAWEPSDRFNVNLIWEHFGEDDNRSRTGKQLCTTDPGPTQIGSYKITNPELQGRLSQGCLPRSLFTDAAYGTPNGMGMAQVVAAGSVVYGQILTGPRTTATVLAVDIGTNPYAGVVQSKDLREIATAYDPRFVVNNDVYQMNAVFDLTHSIKITSQTAYAKDYFWSTQDYMRYPSNDIFNDSRNLYDNRRRPIGDSLASPGGVYTDPQLGPSQGMLSADISKSKNEQFYQEIRIQSNLDGRFNFNLGANYLKFDTQDDYYVFNNLFSLIAEYNYNSASASNGAKITTKCLDGSKSECVYVDYSPIESIAGDGHNYFRSKNVVSTRSWGIFGEGYLDISDDLSLTLGLRYTDDKKTSTPYPTQLLLGSSDLYGYGYLTGGSVVRGLPASPDVVQSWGAVTGRLVLDWKPSDNVMAYASYARGYKGGGSNPPRPGLDPRVVQYQPLASTFEPEYVDAFEVGLKTNLFDEKMRLNATAFYYDYSDYQVSQIVDRISLNENFDAKSMGLEFELTYNITPSFRVDANVGYLKTKIDDGETSIDVMNRTQGNADWMLVRPWLQVPSNCIAPVKHVEKIMTNAFQTEGVKFQAMQLLCGATERLGSFDPSFGKGPRYWQMFGIDYNPLRDAPNGGRGFDVDLGGNELPNAPRWTASLGAQYTWQLGSFDATLRGDYYRQAESYFRIYNTEYDKLESWDNVNLSLSIENMESNFVLSAYVKNVFDDSPIVDAFTNSDDTMLTTNVFTLDPRLFGVSLTKRF